MPLSEMHAHPTGVANPVVLRATAVLAAAWDAAPLEIPCAGFWWMRPYFTYQRGNLAGAMDYYYDVSPYAANIAGVEDWFHGSLYVPGDLAPCATVRSHVQQEYIRYCATSDDAETFVGPPIHLAGCIERIRMFCRESGNVDWLGTAQVVALFYIEG